MMSSDSELWVCWKKPDRKPFANTVVLSFLSPADQESFTREHNQGSINAYEASVPVRKKAREVYLDISARIGTARLKDGRTLRQALARPGEASRWWYHMASFKDSESEPIFNWMIALQTINRVASERGLRKLRLFGSPWEIAEVLKGKFCVEERDSLRPPSQVWIWLRGFLSRVRYAARTFWESVVARRTALPETTLDAVFFGFWDFSVRWDQASRLFADNYFKALPEELKRRGVRSAGWFAWLDQLQQHGNRDRGPAEIAAALGDCPKSVVLLQAFLNAKDIVSAAMDFGPLAVFLKLRGELNFRDVFRDGDFDYYPLFKQRLLHHFLHSNMAHCELTGLAAERAAKRYQPKLAFSFQEHFTHSRAHYDGLRRAGRGTVSVIMQHAGMNHEKAFFFLHPEIEFDGKPDNCPVPVADYVCAMGAFGKKLFLECGYPEERVLLTGSPRYDYIGSVSSDNSASLEIQTDKKSSCRILLVCSRDVETKMDFIQAVYLAALGMNNVELCLRKFSTSSIEENPRFFPYKDRFTVTKKSLKDDIADADLVMFTYSTVAEEAFLQGKPVWQWVSWEFDGSVIGELCPIPKFGSVARLREALEEFLSDPSRFRPSREAQKTVEEQLFYRADGQSAKRMASACLNLMDRKDGRGKLLVRH